MQLPEVLDNSILSTFRSCQTKGRYQYFDNLSPAGESIHLHAGGCFARGREVAYRRLYAGVAPPTAMAEARFEFEKAWGGFVPVVETNKTKPRVWDAIEQYVAFFQAPNDHIEPLRNAGVDPFEFSFAIPMDREHGFADDLIHPETGNPFLYAGKFDMIGNKAGVVLTIVDDKTTTALGASWEKKWSLRSQFIGYVACMQVLGFAVDTVQIRGIAFKKTETSFALAEKSYPSSVVARWRQQTIFTVRHMLHAAKTGEWEMDFGDTCASFNGCAFLDLCRSQTPEDYFGSFETRVWNPLTHGKGGSE